MRYLFKYNCSRILKKALWNLYSRFLCDQKKGESERLANLAQRTAAVFSLIMTTGFSGAVQAAEEEPSLRWYQVELIVFAQRPLPGSLSENWPRDIALAFPPNWVELKKTEPETQTAMIPGATEPGVTTSNTTISNTTTETVSNTIKSEAGETQSIAALNIEAFKILPEKEFEMTNEANDLKKDGRYRILFHHAWRQPVTNRDNAPAVLVYGGTQYGNHHELEGSITVSVSRYLHVHTNLWHSTFKPNYGQKFDDWPELPLKPSLENEPASLSGFSDQQFDQWDTLDGRATKYETILQSPYVVEQIVTLRQARKMRSGEMHYIDHPNLGLLVKIIPYKPSESNESEKKADNSL